MTTDFSELQQRVMQNKKNHNFNTTDIKFELLLLYGEVNELFQAWLKDDSDNLKEEIADIQIYLLGIAEMLNIDLGKETLNKMAINEKRVYQNGKKTISE